ncbi:alpha/beta hydrolase [uncultured Schumannella sp.]|uniref:alpha/beta hydrolase n=1 Tax=uncultured Schumannella sp. TaxID=1195956 RepID=UPI0025CD6244|nr:alpha/beta hydrolase [uncultured Schumannella sp.]
MEITAILTTSAAVTGVAEVLGMIDRSPATVPASLTVSAVSPATSSADRIAFEAMLAGDVTPSASVRGGSESPWIGSPDPFIGPRAVVGVGQSASLANLRGTALLTQLAALPRVELDQFVTENPTIIAETLAAPPLASDVVVWWEATAESERAALIDVAPELVGGLDGVDYASRDVANRARLTTTVDEIESRLAEQPGRAEAAELETRLHMLEQIVAALEPGESGLARTLILLDTTDDGRAAIGIGALETAEYVSYVVPGMFFGVDAQLVAWTDMADALAVEQNEWLARLAPAAGESAEVLVAGADLAPQAATVSWIGYRTPSLLNVASMDLAREGRDTLTSALQGFDALRPTGAYVSVFAHSYGSTAALLALEENDVTVDALALLGSPGSPAQTASELNVRDANVWVGVAPWDPIPSTGVFGSQPASEAYGANHFAVDGAIDPITGEELGGAFSHNDYFTPGGESFRNLALIGIDRTDLVIGAGVEVTQYAASVSTGASAGKRVGSL